MNQFFGVENLPNGHADDSVIPGCVVLEGGALDALMEQNINLQTTIGVSGGAMNGTTQVQKPLPEMAVSLDLILCSKVDLNKRIHGM